VLHTPGLTLGILESITRSAVIDVVARIGMDMRQGFYTLDAVLDADEVVAMSTVREVRAVGRVDDHIFSPGDGTAALQAGFRELVDEELGR
jgi:branched-subunit amino acid aminotransferase/4-amino-4-deoxychorismate lyase